MEALGVLALVSGVWCIYAGVTDIAPLATIGTILRSPQNASAIIAQAKAAGGAFGAAVSNAAGAVAGAVGDAGLFKSWKIVDTFEGHKKRGSVSPGIDFGVPVGTPIPAPVSGLLTFSGPNTGGYGNLATITTKDGHRLHFGHLSSFSGTGNREVKPGDIIALSGGAAGAVGSGTSTGAHIHWDVQTPAGGYVEPLSWLASRAVKG